MWYAFILPKCKTVIATGVVSICHLNRAYCSHLLVVNYKRQTNSIWLFSLETVSWMMLNGEKLDDRGWISVRTTINLILAIRWNLGTGNIYNGLTTNLANLFGKECLSVWSLMTNNLCHLTLNNQSFCVASHLLHVISVGIRQTLWLCCLFIWVQHR